jgi:hypothetical protein
MMILALEAEDILNHVEPLQHLHIRGQLLAHFTP